MGREFLSVVVVVGLLAGACGSSSSPVAQTYSLGHFPNVPTGSFSQSTRGALQAVLDAAIDPGGLPGITATVLAADGEAWSGAAGTADGVHPVEVRSQFSIASLTKTVIAAEVMRLSEKGLLRLIDPVSEHPPSKTCSIWRAASPTRHGWVPVARRQIRYARGHPRRSWPPFLPTVRNQATTLSTRTPT